MKLLYLRIVQYAGFFGAQITNSIVLLFIHTKAERLFGSYRHIMSIFATYSLIYSWIEVATLPVMHIVGPMFVVYMDSSLKYEKWIGNNIICLYCASYALCISLLAAQFFYRYIAICRVHSLVHLEGAKILVLLIPCLLCFISWFLLVFFGMENTVEKQEYLKKTLRVYYNEDSAKVSFIGPLYWSIDENGQKHWNIGQVLSSAGCAVIILLCLLTIFNCAYQTYFKMKVSESVMSKKTKELNRQLFITLSFQTLFPLFMMYSPVGLLLTLPMLGLEAGQLANFTAASAGVYPFFEPLIALFCIRDFREALLCRKKKIYATTGLPISHILTNKNTTYLP